MSGAMTTPPRTSPSGRTSSAGVPEGSVMRIGTPVYLTASLRRRLRSDSLTLGQSHECTAPARTAGLVRHPPHASLRRRLRSDSLTLGQSHECTAPARTAGLVRHPPHASLRRRLRSDSLT